MDTIKKQFMNKAMEILEAGLAGERLQTSAQVRLVSQIADALEKAWNAGIEEGLDAGEHVDCDDDECDECLGSFAGAKFKIGQKVRALRKNWSQTARDLYGKETYTITDRSRNDADEIEYELTSNVYAAEKTVIRENDTEWEIYEVL